jgi:Dolichyl-phosphate-mannose-protein mannosyltransferase
LAAALALMTKYWVLTMIGAVGLAALIHPDRMKFLRSPAPWVAIVTAILAMIPHLMWLAEVDFVPLTYAGDVYGHFTRVQTAMLVLGYVDHNLGLLALPVLIGALAVVGISRRRPSAALARIWSPGPNSAVNLTQAMNVWIIQIVVAVGPPLGGLIFSVYMKTDWGISLFFLTPLALVAIPRLRLPNIALFRIAATWLVLTLATLAASPYIAIHEFNDKPSSAFAYSARSQLARDLTQMWHSRFFTRWSVVAGTTEVGEPVTFYSPDHPAPLTPGEVWSSGLTSLEEATRLGFIGICDTADNRLPECDAWMAKNAKDAEQVVVDAPRFFKGRQGPLTTWKVYIKPPAN